MNFYDKEQKVNYLFVLINCGYKGQPKDFAFKLNVPLRTFYRLLDILKMKYGDIEYDRTTHTYHFLETSPPYTKH